jgi:transposase
MSEKERIEREFERYGNGLNAILESFMEAGISRKQAASVLNVPFGTLSRWIRENNIDWPRALPKGHEVQRVVREFSRYGRTLEAILVHFARQERTRSSVAELMGVSRVTLGRWIERYNIEWPRGTEESRAQIRKGKASKTRHFVIWNGEQVALAEFARLNGIDYPTAFYRYKQGMPPEAIISGKKEGRSNLYHRTLKGLSETEQAAALELVKALGIRAASSKLNIPIGVLKSLVE